MCGHGGLSKISLSALGAEVNLYVTVKTLMAYEQASSLYTYQLSLTVVGQVS